MTNFAGRLNAIFEAATATARVINVNDQYEAKTALSITRGPSVGWEDYIAGRDYQPPYVYNTSDSKVQHTARTGKDVAISSPAIPIGPKDEKGANPHSAKYGGVRPWSPDELLTCLLYRSQDKDMRGALWPILNRAEVKRAFINSGQTPDIDSLTGHAAEAAWKEAQKDASRPGVKFTSFIGTRVQEMITSGGPAGWNNEFKTASGILSRWKVAARKAINGLTKGDKAGLNAAQEALAAISNEHNQMDPNPGPKNRLGNLVTRLIQVGGDLIAAIRNRDLDRLTVAASNTAELYDDITEQSIEYRTRGPSTNTMITKSKTAPPIMVGQLQRKSKDSDEEVEVSNIHSPGKLPSTKAYGTWAFKWSDAKGEHTKSVEDPVAYLQIRTDMGHGEATEYVNARKPISLNAAGKYPKGELVYTAANSGNEYSPTEISIRNNPQAMEALVAFVHRARLGAGTGLSRQARLASDIIKKFRKVISKLDTPIARRKYATRQKNNTYEVRSDRGGWWIDDGETLETVAGPFYTERKAYDEYQKLMQTARDYEVYDTESGEVVGSHEIPSDAKRQLDSLSANPLLTTVRNTIDTIGTEDYGEFAVELIEIGRQLISMLRTGDRSVLGEIVQDLDELEEVATERQGADDEQQTVRPLTQQQYRIFLRVYGLSDYPERGEIDDPEIGDKGIPSRWAQMGYPPMEPKEIADELGLSSTRVSQHRAKINQVLPDMIQQVKMKEELDPIDHDLLTELQKAFHTVFIEYINLVGYDAIFG